MTKYLSNKKLIAAAIIIFLLVFYVAVRNSTDKEEIPTVTIKRGMIVEEAEAVGYIKPSHSITVKSQINGTVAEIYRYEGEYIQKGTPLLKIDPTPAPDVYAAAYQQVTDTVAREKAAQLSLQRYAPALKSKLIDKNYTDYINAQQSYDSAKAQRLLAGQKLALLERGATTVAGKSIANIVVSPIDGYVINRIVDIGDPVISISSAQSATPIFIVADMQDLMFQGTVDEVDAAKVKAGMPAKITIGSLSDQEIKGALTRVALQSENETANTTNIKASSSPFNVGFKVEITNLELPKDLIIRSGYSATAKIKIKTAVNVMLLPARALQFKDDKPYVLLPPQKEGKEPLKRFIQVGVSDGINVEIKEGLQVGDKILDKQEASK